MFSVLWCYELIRVQVATSILHIPRCCQSSPCYYFTQVWPSLTRETQRRSAKTTSFPSLLHLVTTSGVYQLWKQTTMWQPSPRIYHDGMRMWLSIPSLASLPKWQLATKLQAHSVLLRKDPARLFSWLVMGLDLTGGQYPNSTSQMCQQLTRLIATGTPRYSQRNTVSSTMQYQKDTPCSSTTDSAFQSPQCTLSLLIVSNIPSWLTCSLQYLRLRQSSFNPSLYSRTNCQSYPRREVLLETKESCSRRPQFRERDLKCSSGLESRTGEWCSPHWHQL